MQAGQAPEARISDAHQRNCVKAFIVIMDGQTPNWKTLDVFPSLFYFSLLKMMCGTKSRKNVSAGLLEARASFLFYTTIINSLFVVKLYYVAHDGNVESFKLDLSVHAVSHDCLLLPVHVLMIQSVSGLPQHM